MARSKFDPTRVLGEKIKDMSRQELCGLVVKLCAVVRAEAGAGGVRGGIYPDNISMDAQGAVAVGPAAQSDWEGQELQFAAPELYWNGKRSPASDVYSLGLLLYYGVDHGRLPFEGECSDAQLRRMSGDPITAPAGAGHRLGDIILTATQFKAADRYQSMEELGTLLDSCVKNVYLNGAPSAKTIFNKDDEQLNDLERMMVGIIERSDAAAASAPAEEAEPETAADEPQSPAQPDEDAAPESVSGPETEAPAAGSGEDVKIYPSAGGDDAPDAGKEKPAAAKKPPVVLLREEKNPELAPVVPAKPVKTPAVQYTRNLDREKKIAEEVKKRRRRSVAVILVLCAALVVMAIIFNALFHDLNDAPVPDNVTGSGSQTPSDYSGSFDGSDGSADGTVTDGAASGGVIMDSVTDGGGSTDAAGGDTGSAAAGGESTYQLFVEDVSWTQAQARCIAKGGYLAVVSSEEELNKIIELADAEGVEMLWLGCHRVDGELVWENGETVDYYPWGAGEPSLEDTGDNVSEDYLLLWYHNGWVYNDSRNDPVADYPQWYSGNIAYVCEFNG